MTRVAHIVVVLMLALGISSARGSDPQVDSSGRFPSDTTLQYIVREIEFSGDTSFAITPHKLISKTLIDNALSGVVEELRQRGYFFASAEIISMALASDSVDIIAAVRFGPQVKIQGFRCDGLERTSESTVDRYISDFEGDLLTPGRLREIESRARQISYLLFDSMMVVPLPGYSGATIVLRFREPASIALQGNAGYRADDKNGFLWSLAGMIRNVIGDGREVRINSERRDRSRNTLVLQYRQPAFWFGRGMFDAQLRSRDYRDQFSEFSINAGISSFVGDRDKIGGKVGWSRTDFADSTPEYQKYTAGVHYHSVSLSDSTNPNSGHAFGWMVDYQYRAYRNSTDSSPVVHSSVNESKTRLRAEVYSATISPRLIGMGRLDVMSIFSDESKLPTSELFLLGGPGTIRGYRTDQFAARRAAIGSAEIRLRGNQGYVFLFGDCAYIYQQLSGGTNDEIVKAGYGIGLRLIDRDKLLELGVGWNPDARFNRPQVMLKLASGL